MSTRMPAVFLGHGSPMNAIEENAWRASWQTLAKRLPRTRAVLVVSAHWESEGAAVTAAAASETIHDFYGFPQALFDVRYPAPRAIPPWRRGWPRCWRRKVYPSIRRADWTTAFGACWRRCTPAPTFRWCS